MPFIILSDVSFRYDDSPTLALDSVNICIEPGDYVAIVGANGSGKSTLLRLLNGLRNPSSGSVRIDGVCTSDVAQRAFFRASVGLVTQSPEDQIVASVTEEDVAFGPENLGCTREEISRRVEAALSIVGLTSERLTPPLFLSAGQQQRLAIAGALALGPRCVAFDEATAMLDPVARESVLAAMDALSASGVAVVHGTHDMDEVARAKRVIALDEGRVAFDGSTADYFRAGAPRGGPTLAVVLADKLGLPPIPGESAAAIAARIVAARAIPVCAHASDGDSAMSERPRQHADFAFCLRDVRYSYLRGTPRERIAVDGATADIPRGSVVALVGRTGSGKSSLLQLCNALAFPHAGSVSSFGVVTTHSGADLKRVRTRAPLSVQKPERALFEFYAGDDVAYGPRNLGFTAGALVERVRASMDAVGLPYGTFRDRRTRSLSGGEKRKLALAGVIAMAPDALLLDEPTSALDPASKQAALDIVRTSAADGTTVILTTHSMEEAARADLVGVMKDGRLVAFDTPANVFFLNYDDSWGIGLPFAGAVAQALSDFSPDFKAAIDVAIASGNAAPLTIDALADLIRMPGGSA